MIIFHHQSWVRFSLARYILGYQDFAQNLPKTLICDFSNAGQKPSKNPLAIPKKLEKPSKNPPPEGFLKVFEGFWDQKAKKRAARACARSTFFYFLMTKTFKNLQKTIWGRVF